MAGNGRMAEWPGGWLTGSDGRVVLRRMSMLWLVLLVVLASGCTASDREYTRNHLAQGAHRPAVRAQPAGARASAEADRPAAVTENEARASRGGSLAP